VTKTYLKVLAIAVALPMVAMPAQAGEYGNRCAAGMANGFEAETDCSVSEDIDGKTYCFGDEDAKAAFMEDPAANIEKADAYAAKTSKD
jgi:YHS domain-containing protein